MDFCVPIFFGALAALFSLVKKHEGLPWIYSAWLGICFLVFSPLRYVFFLLALFSSYPVQSFHALFTLIPLSVIIPIAFGILLFLGLVLPLFGTLGLLEFKAKKPRYVLSSIAAPFLALLGSLVFSVVITGARYSTHWLRAEDVIGATNGPAIVAFGLLSPYQVAMPDYAASTPGKPTDLLRCHVAFMYLGDEEQAKFLALAYPDIYDQYRVPKASQ